MVCTFWLQRWSHIIRTSCWRLAAQAGTLCCASLGPGSCLWCCTRAQLARLCCLVRMICYGSSPDCCLLCNKRDVVVRSRVHVHPAVCGVGHAVVLVCCWWRYARISVAMPACCWPVLWLAVLCEVLVCCAGKWICARGHAIPLMAVTMVYTMYFGAEWLLPDKPGNTEGKPISYRKSKHDLADVPEAIDLAGGSLHMCMAQTAWKCSGGACAAAAAARPAWL